MKKQIYSVYDNVAKEYAPMFLANNDEVAKRMFHQTLSKVAYPTDYMLVFLGSFSIVTGSIYSLEHPRIVESPAINDVEKDYQERLNDEVSNE